MAAEAARGRAKTLILNWKSRKDGGQAQSFA
jgi:hypothetical protein